MMLGTVGQLSSETLGPRWVSRRVSAVALALLGAALLLPACGSKPPPAKPKVITVELQAASNLNPNVNGRPSPVVVRLYELKSAAQFQSTDFVTLFEKDQSALGADVVVREEFVLNPGESKLVSRGLGADSKFIAVMVAFRDLERAKWRSSAQLDPGRDNALVVRLEASTVQLLPR